MPFFDDSGFDETIDRGPFWSAFAIFGSQLEKMIAVNIAWSLQFAPAIFAMIFINAPDVIRILLILYTIIAVPPATAVVGLAKNLMVTLSTDGVHTPLVVVHAST